MGNPFVHVELQTQDPTKARQFYQGLFDWKFEEWGGSTPYTVINVGEGTGGGLMKSPMPGAPSQWLAYALVSDVAASTQKAKSLGGKVLVEPMKVEEHGWLGVIQDPTGAVLGLWQPAQMPAQKASPANVTKG